MSKQGFDKLLESVGKLAFGIESVTKKVADLKAAGPGKKIEAATVHPLVKPFADKLRTCAGEMHAAGIGSHPTDGHGAVLHRMADSMEAEAIMGKMPHIYRGHDYLMRAGGVQGLDKAVKDLSGQIAAAVKGMQAARAGNGRRQRASMPVHIQSLLTRNGLTLEAAQGMSTHELDEAFTKAGTKRQDGMKIKLALHHAGHLQ